MHHAIPFITAIVDGLMFAFTLGMVANKLHISPLVGYLLAGVLASLFTPGSAADTKLAPKLAELDVILLAFGVGLHFSLEDLTAVEPIAVPDTIAQMAVAALLGMVLSAVLGWSLMVGIVFGLCLSTASTVILLRALEEQQLIDSQRGQIAIGWLIVGDLMVVLTLVLLPAVAGMLEEEDVGFASLTVDMGIVIGKVVAFIAIMILVDHRLVPWIMTHSAATGSRELFTPSVLALALGIAFGAVELFDVFLALGAFFAGVVLNESELSHRTAHDTLPLRDAFAMLFFVSAGMLFDLLVLIQQPLTVLGTLTTIIFGKSLAAYFLMRLFDHSQHTALTIVASLTQVGEFAFILAGLGMALDLLSQARQDPVLAGVILSIMLSPVLFAVLEKYLVKTETLGEQTLGEAIKEEKQIPVDTCNHALLVGFGRVSSLLGEKLMAAGIPLVVIEASRTRVDKLRERGIHAVLGNVANEEIMNLAHLGCTRWLLLTIPNGYGTDEIIASVREKYPSIEIIARAHYDDEVEHITERSANQIVMGEREIARTMLELVKTSSTGEIVTAS